MSYFVYILRSSSNQLYIGQTNDVRTRIKDHLSKNSKAAKFTKGSNNFKLVYKEEFQSRIDAMHRELQLKGWSRAKKEALIAGDINKLKGLSKRKVNIIR